MSPRQPSLCLTGVVLLAAPLLVAGLTCQNGGTYNRVSFECICTPHYYGVLCETSFNADNPCSRWRRVTVIEDKRLVHRFGSIFDCRINNSCIHMDMLTPNWYRFESHAGSYLSQKCPNARPNCGTMKPMILALVKKEENENLNLKSGRIVTFVEPEINETQCYLSGAKSYSVRILRCTSTVTLYFLRALAHRQHHFCIGDKRLCDQDSKSVDGTGFEPCIRTEICNALPLQQPKPPVLTLRRDARFTGFDCTAFASFNSTSGVKYSVKFIRSLKNGSTAEFNGCSQVDVDIPEGGSRNFSCETPFGLEVKTNIYGETLVCQVTARCDRTGGTYNSAVLTSNIHSFMFKYKFNNGKNVIRPGESAELCVSAEDMPLPGTAKFVFAVRRQQIVMNDRIDIASVQSDGNGSLPCGVELNMQGNHFTLCHRMTLMNDDTEGRMPVGLRKAEQIRLVTVKISFKSNDSGLYNDKLVFIGTIDIMVNLSRLQTDVTTYMHLYAGSYLKSADRSYSDQNLQDVGEFVLLKHKRLPYEVQALMHRIPVNSLQTAVTEVAIRYFYHVIRIFGDSSGNLHFTVKETLPKTVTQNPMPLTDEGLPRGVKVENSGRVVKIKMEIYGMIMYVWGFGIPDSACGSRFKMNSMQMQQKCTSDTIRVAGKILLDVILIPGFYDTKSQVEGLVYANLLAEDTDKFRPPSDENLFSESEFRPKEIPKYQQHDIGVLSICRCGGKDVKPSGCYVNFEATNRTRAGHDVKTLNPPIGPTQQPPQLSTRPITEEEASRFCDKFPEKKQSKKTSSDICSHTKDPTGGSDYMQQFKLICAQYARTLGTFAYTDSLFNSMLGICYQDMTFNVTVVKSNSRQIELIRVDLCPANCSNRGQCVSGECSCEPGFTGPKCELETKKVAAMPTQISLDQQPLCSSADAQVFLTAYPNLKSMASTCAVRVLNENDENPTIDFSVPSEFVTGDTVSCRLSSVFEHLQRRLLMYQALRISLSSSSWQSSNSVQVTAHQSSCFGRPVECQPDGSRCRVRRSLSDVAVSEEEEKRNFCEAAGGSFGSVASTRLVVAVGAFGLALLQILGRG